MRNEETGLDENLLVRFFTNESKESENKIIYKWIKASPENKKQFLEWKTLWDAAAYNWTNSLNIEEEFNTLMIKQSSRHSKARFQSNNQFFMQRLYRVAAFIVLLVTIGWLSKIVFYQDKSESKNLAEFNVLKENYGLISLPDGSKVSLYSDFRFQHPRYLFSCCDNQHCH